MLFNRCVSISLILFQVIVQNEATGKNPAKDNFKGMYNFEVKTEGNDGGATWNVSLLH